MTLAAMTAYFVSLAHRHDPLASPNSAQPSLVHHDLPTSAWKTLLFSNAAELNYVIHDKNMLASNNALAQRLVHWGAKERLYR